MAPVSRCNNRLISANIVPLLQQWSDAGHGGLATPGRSAQRHGMHAAAPTAEIPARRVGTPVAAASCMRGGSVFVLLLAAACGGDPEVAPGRSTTPPEAQHAAGPHWSTGESPCGPLPERFECWGCDDVPRLPECVNATWTCPLIDGCSPCGPRTLDCIDDCTGEAYAATCSGTTWSCTAPSCERAALWSLSIGGATPSAVATNAAGEVVVVGAIEGAADVGGTPLASAGKTDAFVLKLSATGTPQWVRRFGDTETQTMTSVALGSDGSPVVAGRNAGNVRLDGKTLHVAEGEHFIAKLDAQGTVVWSRQLPLARVRLDGAQNVHGAGTTEAGVLRAMLTSAGEPTWSLESTGLALGGFDVDATGRSVIAGTAVGQFGADAGTGALVLEHDVGGIAIGALSWGGAGDARASDAAFGGDGSLFVLGEAQGDSIFGDQLVTGGDESAVFVGQLDTSRAARWVQTITHGSSTAGSSRWHLRAAPTGGIVLAGSLNGACTIGKRRLVARGKARDVVTARMSDDGATVWLRRHASFFGDDDEAVTDLAVDGTGSPIAVGVYSGVLDLGNGPLPAGPRAFVAKFAP